MYVYMYVHLYLYVYLCESMYCMNKGTLGGVMVSKLDWQTYTSEFESH